MVVLHIKLERGVATTAYVRDSITQAGLLQIFEQHFFFFFSFEICTSYYYSLTVEESRRLINNNSVFVPSVGVTSRDES